MGLIKEKQPRPEELYILTFTNKGFEALVLTYVEVCDRYFDANRIMYKMMDLQKDQITLTVDSGGVKPDMNLGFFGCMFGPSSFSFYREGQNLFTDPLEANKAFLDAVVDLRDQLNKDIERIEKEQG